MQDERLMPSPTSTTDIDIPAMDPEEGPDKAVEVDLSDPKVREAIRQAKRQVHDASQDIMQQLSVALQDPEFRDHIRELHPESFHIATQQEKTAPLRQGKSRHTKPKIDAPARRKKNKAARKARKKGH